MGKCLSSPAALVVYIPLEASPTPPTVQCTDSHYVTIVRRIHMGAYRGAAHRGTDRGVYTDP